MSRVERVMAATKTALAESLDRKLLTVQMAGGFGGGGAEPRPGSGAGTPPRQLDFSLSSIGVGGDRSPHGGGGWQHRSSVQGDGGLSPYPVDVTNHLLSIGAPSPRK